ncbi:multiple C2 and transmembrane domain-containing protein 1-like isoform X2 [Oscarella lobularis]|uniref:multiple C2 and transmembrane domain-containing protein 1-like isoform X2 n=1 Tax=Oscarella lobularis TaxID=121494 RepID=UPI003313AFE9
MSESRFAFGSPTASMMEHDDDDGESRESTPTWHNTSETKPKKKKGFWRLGSLRKRIGKGKKKDRGHASSASFDELDFSSSPPPRATSAVPPEIVKSLDGSPVYRRRFPKTHSLDRIDTSSRVDGKTGNDAEVHVGGGEVDSSSFAGAETASTESRRRRKSWQMAAQNQNRTLESQDSADFVTTIRRAESTTSTSATATAVAVAAAAVAAGHQHQHQHHAPALQPHITVTDTEIETEERRVSQPNDVPETPRKKPKVGRQYNMTVLLIGGRNLAVRDRSGKSDPYVKMKLGRKQRRKSSTIQKNLNPNWNEPFHFFISDIEDSFRIKVYDYDFGLKDDFMGAASLDLTEYDVDKPNDVQVHLEDEDAGDEELGYLLLTITLVEVRSGREATPFSRPSSPSPSHHDIKLKRPKSADMHTLSKRHKSQLWKGILTVVLLNGKNLPAMDDNGFSDPYCKFRLGQEKYKSKVISKTLNPEWKEQFDLHILDPGQSLEIDVYDRDYGAKDDFIGRCKVDLDELESDKTHHKTLDLQQAVSGRITVMLTISGTMESLAEEEETDLTTENEKKNLNRTYSIMKTFSKLSDIGHLRVKVIKAVGLHGADLGGTSDPFAVLELGNGRVRTPTVYKNVNPEWGKVFSLKVKDVHSLLEITVFDEDKHRNEFLGRTVIPLLSILPGEKRWYQLKDRKLRGTVKGQIQLEMDLVFNPIRACIRTFNPREAKILAEDEKFKRQALTRNIQRVANIVRSIMSFWAWLQSLWEWESTSRSLLAFFVFLVTVYFFDWWMPFVLLILIFVYQYFVTGRHRKFVIAPGSLSSASEYSTNQQGYTEIDSDDETEDESDSKGKDEKKSLRQKYQAILDVCLNVQTITDWLACLGERIKNTFTWTVPFQSVLAIVVLSVAAVIFYFVPPRYLVLLWGINKFTKRLRKPHFIPNNELLDFLSRLPSDNEITLWSGTKHPSGRKKKKK